MSGAVVCVQEVPPFVVTKTPRFVLDPLEESEIEAYTVLSVANCGEIPRSMRPPFTVAPGYGNPRAAKATLDEAKPTNVPISPDAEGTMFQVLPPSAEQYTPSVAPCPNCCAATKTICGLEGFTAT